MSLFNVFKKENIPDELPKLASDEFNEKFKIKIPEGEKKLSSDYLAEEEGKVIEKDLRGFKIEEENDFPEGYDSVAQKKVKLSPKSNYPAQVSEEEVQNSFSLDKSFFDDLQKDISDEMNKLDDIEDWYEKKFLQKDIVSDMRRYWEGQKSDSVAKILGKNFKERIAEKTDKLQNLERDWQNIYFDLIEKEEEIKEGEAELKGLLAEFVALCKRKKKSSLKPKNNDRKKEDKRKIK